MDKQPLPEGNPLFDTTFDRRGTQSIKWDLKPRNRLGNEVLPMWVADMDFAVPDVVIQALRDRLDHPVFGYSNLRDAHKEAFAAWQERRNRWSIETDWLVFAPGVMPAVRAAILALTEPGDEVVIQPPVYYPFFESVRELGRTLVLNPLIDSGGWHMDLDHLASVITPATRLLLLCSPHNPVGRVWSTAELTKLAGVCLRNNLLILSDEIHGDLVRRGGRFVSLASIDTEVADSVITCNAPTKSFNLAGLASAFVTVSNAEIRSRISTQIHHLGIDLPNIMSLAAAEAAYSGGEPWLEALLDYLSDTFLWYESQLSRFPGISLSKIEGTYLAWLDMRPVIEDLSTSDHELHRVLMDDAGLWLSDGRPFGAPGYVRMNLGCPRGLIREGLDRLERGLEQLS